MASLPSCRALQLPAFLVVAGAIGLGAGLSAVVLVVLLAALFLGAWRVARSVLRLHVGDDLILATWTLAVAWLALWAEVLSYGSWLGSEAGWLVGGLMLYAASLPLRPRCCPVDWRTPLDPVTSLNLPGRLVVLAASIPVVWLSIVVWHSGITVADAFRVYLARAVLYLQHGTFGVYSTDLDYLQYLHATLVMVPMLFLRSDNHVNALSLLSMLLCSVALGAWARSMGWRSWLPLVAAILPWTMPKIVLSAPTASFDILAGLWLLLALYFLRRGHEDASWRWLALAALALALGIATKPTTYFALPGFLGLAGLLIWRAWRLGRLGRLARAGAIGGLLFVLVGCPFLIRNVLTQGYLLAPSSETSTLTGQNGYSFGPLARLRGLTDAMLAYGIQIATPPYWLPEPVNQAIAAWGKGVLPHGVDRYDASMAGLGLGALLLVPAAILPPWAGRRLGTARAYLWWPVWLAGSYLVVLCVVIPISPHSNRYLIEWALILSMIAPALFAVLPCRWAGTLAIILAVPLLLEQYDALTHSRNVPPAVVTSMPRERQVYALFGYHDPETRVGVEAFERRYPPGAMPVVYLARRFDVAYLFNGPSLSRRAVFWTVPDGDQVALPGPTLTQNPRLVERLGRQPNVRVDQLSATVWLLLPR